MSDVSLSNLRAHGTITQSRTGEFPEPMNPGKEEEVANFMAIPAVVWTRGQELDLTEGSNR